VGGPTDRKLYRWADLQVDDWLTINWRPERVHEIRPDVGGLLGIRTTKHEMLANPAKSIASHYQAQPGPQPHFPVCHRCGETWPCIHHQAVNQAQVALVVRRCEHCHELINERQNVTSVNVLVNGRVPLTLHFHGRIGVCFDAAEALRAQQPKEP
jgi:hypothetical protein